MQDQLPVAGQAQPVQFLPVPDQNLLPTPEELFRGNFVRGINGMTGRMIRISGGLGIIVHGDRSSS